MNKRKVAIDLTWLRHGKVGGTESSIINLLNGLEAIEHKETEFYLITAVDNRSQFEGYFSRGSFLEIPSSTVSDCQIKRVLWQNLKLCRELKKYNITDCIEPIYSIPLTPIGHIRFYTIIHDLQAWHFPEYFNSFRVAWMRLSWNNTMKKAFKIVAISNFVEDDIKKHYRKIHPEKIVRIYDAVDINSNEIAEESMLDEIGVHPNSFYFTVSSLLPHKNLKTILLALSELKGTEHYYPLVISGVGGKQKQELMKLAKDIGIENNVILTGYIDNQSRNLLYKTCKTFLFPSRFEGFGMPPVEAIILNALVLTTKCTSIEEVTDGLANYVSNENDYKEWAEKLSEGIIGSNHINSATLEKKYSSRQIASEYYDLLRS